MRWYEENKSSKANTALEQYFVDKVHSLASQIGAYVSVEFTDNVTKSTSISDMGKVLFFWRTYRINASRPRMNKASTEELDWIASHEVSHIVVGHANRGKEVELKCDDIGFSLLGSALTAEHLKVFKRSAEYYAPIFNMTPDQFLYATSDTHPTLKERENALRNTLKLRGLL